MVGQFIVDGYIFGLKDGNNISRAFVGRMQGSRRGKLERRESGIDCF